MSIIVNVISDRINIYTHINIYRDTYIKLFIISSRRGQIVSSPLDPFRFVSTKVNDFLLLIKKILGDSTPEKEKRGKNKSE